MKQLFLITLCSLILTTTGFCKTIEIVTTDFPPYVYIENNEIKGFNVDLLKEIFKQMDMEIKIKIMPWARALSRIEKGETDAMFPLFKTKEREIFTDYSDAFTTEDTALFVLKDSPIKWNGNLNDLTQYRFGRVRGYSSGTKIDELIKENKIILDEVDKTNKNIKKLLGGRFDIMIEAQYVALHELNKMGKSDKVRMLAIVQQNLSHLGFSKKRNHISTIHNFNKILIKMKEDGTYQKIIDDFFQNKQ